MGRLEDVRSATTKMKKYIEKIRQSYGERARTLRYNSYNTDKICRVYGSNAHEEKELSRKEHFLCECINGSVSIWFTIVVKGTKNGVWLQTQ